MKAVINNNIYFLKKKQKTKKNLQPQFSIPFYEKVNDKFGSVFRTIAYLLYNHIEMKQIVNENCTPQ